MPKDLFTEATIKELKDRIGKISPQTSPLWGKMDAAHMMTHCVEVMRNAMGEIQQKRKFLGYLVAPFLRHRYYNDILFKGKNVPSTFMVADTEDFAQAKTALLKRIDLFYQSGEEACQGAVHPMLGRFTPQQWAIGQYKHLDHHLRQFGV
ncbi:MAG: DUF1569 domain-containing protein [Bacteroidota bacterium]